MSHRRFAPFLMAIVLAALAQLHTVAGQPQPDRWTQAALAGVLDAYFAGRYDEAVATAAAIEDLGPFRLRFVQDVPWWITADAARAEQRRAAVAAFLLELTRSRLESDWLRLIDLVEWMCLDLRSGHPAPAFEQAWHHASVAIAGRARARLWLLGEFAVLPHQKPVRVREQSKDPSPRHLMHALERFPDDSRLQLARIVAWTWGRDREPTRNVQPHPAVPAPAPRRPQMESIVALQPLVADPTVGAEALVRIGQMHFTVGDDGAALRAFEAAQPRAADAVTRYLARFLAGRALEALKRPAEATEQFRRALEAWPGAESATVALAALRYARDDRPEAVALLRDQFATPPRDDDPGRLVSYGMFVHWPALRTALRAGLPR